MEKSEKDIFFIFGSGRCGTTLLRALLVSHPDICIPGETHFYNQYTKLQSIKYGPMRPALYRQLVDKFPSWGHVKSETLDWQLFHELALNSTPSWDSLFIAYLTAYRLSLGKKIVGEKTPGHFKSINSLANNFPESKFIHIIRDPRAVVASYLKHTFYQDCFGSNVARAAQKWVDAAKFHCKILNSPHSLQARYLMLRYEDLVDDPESVIHKALQHIGADPTQFTMTAYCGLDLDGVNRTNHANIGKPISSAFNNKWKDELSPQQMSIIETICQPYLEKLGYSTHSQSTASSLKLETFREECVAELLQMRLIARKLLSTIT
ncbi:sulfotransferase [Nodosilinea sp. P-1105]|uniref:sulfotransferase family protein n=1 Tax=Nodosilinea sp. P-1105 TaxID=2546229 RepID=UPI00146A1191|nr:sulfotransferase [Nodosilinea sp. P-1105]NMF82640.1 sulfotransferase [Nodosilinea sp. P-1105]